MKILHLDRKYDVMRFIGDQLAGKGHEVVGFTAPTGAVEWLSSNPQDVIITGLSSRQGNQFNRIRKVRELYPDLIIIVLTGHGYESDIMDQSRLAGADGYVSKVAPARNVITQILNIIQTQSKFKKV